METRHKCLTVRVTKPHGSLPREVVDSLSLGAPTLGWSPFRETLLSTTCWTQGRGNRVKFSGLFHTEDQSRQSQWSLLALKINALCQRYLTQVAPSRTSVNYPTPRGQSPGSASRSAVKPVSQLGKVSTAPWTSRHLHQLWEDAVSTTENAIT